MQKKQKKKLKKSEALKQNIARSIMILALIFETWFYRKHLVKTS